jgi:hypothetical protein
LYRVFPLLTVTRPAFFTAAVFLVLQDEFPKMVLYYYF